ncbi:hypothetical protein SAMN05428989_3081 [Pseudoxanthomonas sp. GM95]|uniref:hypothetical protein n=1 Tax=Pseudoxanthomonas sp. GM95 TaxID=1881043 RepID=UPI0008C57970|nr:hypothetical protein [Pseudoxanthomonas sp. GM95]SEM11202.1 hypothetical protein SAMN05428989_3081 [Pseudoxanthomonas sp. GM95]
MRLLRIVALGAAGAVAYTLWKQRQAKAVPVTTYEIDYGDVAPPHGDPLLGTHAAGWVPEPRLRAVPNRRRYGT